MDWLSVAVGLFALFKARWLMAPVKAAPLATKLQEISIVLCRIGGGVLAGAGLGNLLNAA